MKEILLLCDSYDGSAIPGWLVESVRRNQSRGPTAEIVIVDLFRLFLPGFPWILEVADQFLPLGIEAQDGMASVLESFSEIGDELESSVAVRMLRLGDAFAIDTKRVTCSA